MQKGVIQGPDKELDCARLRCQNLCGSEQLRQPLQRHRRRRGVLRPGKLGLSCCAQNNDENTRKNRKIQEDGRSGRERERERASEARDPESNQRMQLELFGETY